MPFPTPLHRRRHAARPNPSLPARRGMLAAALCLAAAFCLALPATGFARTGEPEPAAAAEPAALQRVEDWFTATRSLSADFVQVDEQGRSATGKLWLRRPGRVRFEYDPPVPLMIVADGTFVMFVDRELEQVDRLPLVRSPLSILTADRVDIRRDALVRDLRQEAGMIQLTLADPQAPEEGELTLFFHDNPVALEQWVVRDAAGKETVVSLKNVQLNPDLPNRLFVYTDPAPGSRRNAP